MVEELVAPRFGEQFAAVAGALGFGIGWCCWWWGGPSCSPRTSSTRSPPPFDHVIVSALHLLYGVWVGGDVGFADLALNIAPAIPGNLLGGLPLMTLTHAVQVKASGGD
jgi:hypothetical protein